MHSPCDKCHKRDGCEVMCDEVAGMLPDGVSGVPPPQRAKRKGMRTRTLSAVGDLDGVVVEIVRRPESFDYAFEGISARDRRFLVLRYQYGWTMREIADVAGMEAHAVTVAINRARVRLAERM